MRKERIGPAARNHARSEFAVYQGRKDLRKDLEKLSQVLRETSERVR
jgi:hypothetical protein